MRTLMIALLAAAPASAFAGGLVLPVEDPVVAPVAVAPAPVGRDWSGGWVGAQIGFGDVSTDGSAELDGDGAIGGLSAGYDFDFGRTVAGVGLDYDVSNIELGEDGPTLDSVFRLGGRLGYELGQDGLLYGRAGYAVADVSDGIDSADGYFAGVGYEQFVTESVSAGAEVLYHDFTEFDGDTDLDATATTASLKVNFRF